MTEQQLAAMEQALEALNLARAAHGQMLLSDPPQEAWKAWKVGSVTRSAMEALRAAIEQAKQSQWGASAVTKPEYVAAQKEKTQQALDKMAENARELGLDYEPAGGIQVSKIWWDGDKLMAKPIPLSDIYKDERELGIQMQPEPVAWMYESVCGNDFATRHEPPNYAKNIRPLYTHPAPAAPVQEPDGIEWLKKDGGYFAPPAAQRQWVGLTKEQRDELAALYGSFGGVVATEQLLREINEG